MTLMIIDCYRFRGIDGLNRRNLYNNQIALTSATDIEMTLSPSVLSVDTFLFSKQIRQM